MHKKLEHAAKTIIEHRSGSLLYKKSKWNQWLKQATKQNDLIIGDPFTRKHLKDAKFFCVACTIKQIPFKSSRKLPNFNKECVGANETCKGMIGWKQIERENFMNPNKMTHKHSLTHAQSSTYYPQSTH